MRLPEAFISRTQKLLGNEWDAFEEALKDESPTSIRLNPEKTPAGISHPPLEGVGGGTIACQPVPWASDAYYLSSRPLFTLDPLFHAGCYYVQEASSMYLETIIRKWVSEPIRCLDLCAAPGGKSTHLISTLPKGSLLVANEVIRSRSYILSENLIKWGNPYTVVTNNDPTEIGQLEHCFDIMVTDVPCSGEGMFRKDPAAISEWSVNNVQLCAERQRRIVADVWPALKPGGILIYSTCTYNREENEENIGWICRELGAETIDGPHRFLPHKSKGEGFFIACIRKNEDDSPYHTTRHKKRHNKPNGKEKMPEGIHSWITDPEHFSFINENNTYLAIPSEYQDFYALLKDSLKIVSAGIPLGEIKGKDLIPAHGLSLSVNLFLTAFPNWELDKETALQYLKKEALQNIPPEIPRGYVVVTYRQHPLGFIKNLGNRANNLYPQEWRIRMNIS